MMLVTSVATSLTTITGSARIMVDGVFVLMLVFALIVKEFAMDKNSASLKVLNRSITVLIVPLIFTAAAVLFNEINQIIS